MIAKKLNCAWDSLIQFEMRALRLHRVCKSNYFDDVHKLLSATAIICT